jgi:hypothetical protein
VTVVVVLALIPFAFAASMLRRAYASVAAGDVALVIARGHLDDTATVRLLISRSLSRARRFRTTSSVAVWSAVLAIVVARSLSGAGEFRVSFAELFVAGLAGYLGGAILGETHQLRHAGDAVRVASVAPRSVPRYRTKQLHAFVITGAVAAIGVAGACLVGGSGGANDSHRGELAVVAAAALVVATVVTLMQRRIAWRARPALPAALQRADDALRRRAFAALDSAGGALVWMLTSIAAGQAINVTTTSWLRIVAGLGSLAALCFAVILAWHARGLAWPAKK